MRTFIVLALLVGCLFQAGSARAEPVYIQSGNQVGQGWMFKVGASCVVATAKHVLPVDSGSVVNVRGEYSDIIAVQRHPDLDLAIATIVGKAAANCPIESLGFADSKPALMDASRF